MENDKQDNIPLCAGSERVPWLSEDFPQILCKITASQTKDGMIQSVTFVDRHCVQHTVARRHHSVCRVSRSVKRHGSMARHVHGGHVALPGDCERVPALGEDLHQILHDASERLEADRDNSMRRCSCEYGFLDSELSGTVPKDASQQRGKARYFFISPRASGCHHVHGPQFPRLCSTDCHPSSSSCPSCVPKRTGTG